MKKITRLQCPSSSFAKSNCDVIHDYQVNWNQQEKREDSLFLQKVRLRLKSTSTSKNSFEKNDWENMFNHTISFFDVM